METVTSCVGGGVDAAGRPDAAGVMGDMAVNSLSSANILATNEAGDGRSD